MRFSSSPAATMCSQPLELAVDLPGLDIPDVYLTVIPSPNAHTPVNRFWFHVLQPLSGSLAFLTASALLSTAPPLGTYNLGDLSKAPIPPASYLRSLKKHILAGGEVVLESSRDRVTFEALTHAKVAISG